MINKVVLVGRLTADPEVRQTQSGVSVCNFTVACNRPYQKDGEKQADFINCVAWRQTADFVGKYFTKGNAIGLDGSIQTRKYQDKDGNNRIAVEVLVNNVAFVESKNSGQANNYQSNNTQNVPNQPQTQPQNTNSDFQSSSVDNGDFEELTPGEDLPF